MSTKEFSAKSSWKKKAFIALGFILLLLFAAGLYANYQLDRFVGELNQQTGGAAQNQEQAAADGKEEPAQGSDRQETGGKPAVQETGSKPAAQESGGEAPSGGETSRSDGGSPNQSGGETNRQPGEVSGQPPASGEDSPGTGDKASNGEILATIQDQVDAPIEKMDVLQAGSIVLRKLSSEEINFLFNFSGRKYTKEELEQAREILLTKLSEEEVNILRTLGIKYGKKMNILDPNVPIR